MEITGSAEMLQATYKSTWRHNPENQNLNINPLSINPKVFVLER
jgi:hypothetical protein